MQIVTICGEEERRKKLLQIKAKHKGLKKDSIKKTYINMHLPKIILLPRKAVKAFKIYYSIDKSKVN